MHKAYSTVPKEMQLSDSRDGCSLGRVFAERLQGERVLSGFVEQIGVRAVDLEPAHHRHQDAILSQSADRQ